MQPHVREIADAPIAVTPARKIQGPVNAIPSNASPVRIATAEDTTDAQPASAGLLASRRRRWARLSNRR